MYICVWRYSVNFSVHYNIHYITFTILVRETWNDYLDINIKGNVFAKAIFGNIKKFESPQSILSP